MQDRFVPADFNSLTPLDALVRRSRLIGAEENLVLWGGGNTSSKIGETDPWGRKRTVLRVKGSGADLKAVEAKHFPGIYLDLVEPLLERAAMSDDEMVGFVRHAFAEPGGSRPSIEILLHAFVSHRCVDHTHADACLAITNTPAGEALAREVWGNDFIWIPYQRPGFALSKAVGLAARAKPGATAVVLANHGLITFGDSDEQSYRSHIEYITKAEEFLAKRRKSAAVFTPKPANDFLPELLPRLRGRLSSGERQVLRFMPTGVDATLDEALSYPVLQELIAAGPATPDHTLHVRGRFCLVEKPDYSSADALWNSLASSLDKYEKDYAVYFAAHQDGSQGECRVAPRLIFIPGAGVVAAAPSARRCRIAADIARHWAWIALSAQAAGGYRSLNDAGKFSVEYWPMELYKLTLAPPEKELARRVILITGAAGGIGRAIARRFLAEGACLLLADRDAAGLESLRAELHDDDRVAVCAGDLTDPDAADTTVRAAVRAFGGLDGVVVNAGIARAGAIAGLSDADWDDSMAVNADAAFRLSRASLRLFQSQGLGGNMVFIVTKNTFAPGAEFAAYSASKAAQLQLARVAALEGAPAGVRVNMINPDAVFGDSHLWDGIKPGRAAAHGVPEGELEAFYAGRNLLKVKITAEDVAQAALYLASDRSAKTTGCVLTVDGGIPGAFPR
jgi:rhamnulose-1-phosphate aldolase/alcohol dehydrogenase